MLDRDGSRTPIEFHISNDHGKNPIDAQVVQAATKWKRVALQQFGFDVGEGLYTDMRAVRKDYFLDHDHSAYVDQWDWEQVDHRGAPQPRLPDRRRRRRSGRCSRAPSSTCSELFPQLRTDRYPDLPDELTFLHAEEILERYPDLPRKAARDGDPPGAPGHLHLRHRLAAGRRLSARDARRRLRRLGHADHVRRRQADARPERRHPRLEPGDPAPPRADLDGRPRQRRDAAHAARDDAASSTSSSCPTTRRFSRRQIPLSIGGGIGQSRTYMTLLEEGAPRRGQRHRVAEDPQGDVPRAEHPRARVGLRPGMGSRSSRLGGAGPAAPSAG